MNDMMQRSVIGVGIIGASPDSGGWAVTAHIPALQSLPHYRLVAVSTSRRESAEAASRTFGVSRLTTTTVSYTHLDVYKRQVLYSLSSVWRLQIPDRRFTAIQADGAWRNQIHPGAVYGAVVVDSQYRPPATIDSLPEKGGSVLAVATARGTPTRPSSFLQFSGYQWEVRRNTNGDGHRYDTANALSLIHI